MFVVIGYDCSDDKRRLRLSKVLLDYGYRVQYSLFEAELKRKDFDEMLARIKKIVDGKGDSIRIYHICATCLDQTDLLEEAKLSCREKVFIV